MDDAFESRFVKRRVRLVRRFEDGPPMIEYLPASEGLLIRGKRHLLPAPKKTGKSLAMLVHWTSMVLAGAKVIILDRENGADEYARRLAAIASAWSLTEAQKSRLDRHLRYFEFPRLRREDGPQLARFARRARADVVVFDSQRLFLTDLDLAEKEADDYSAFMNAIIQPLFDAHIATVILDNTGLADTGRGRGTSAKGDLNEVLFTLSVVKGKMFSADREGQLRLKLEPGSSRFGNEGEWTMRIGGGSFSPWLRVGEEKGAVPSGFGDRVTDVLKGRGPPSCISQSALLSELRVRGLHFTDEPAREWLDQLAEQGLIHKIPSQGRGRSAFYSAAPPAEEQVP